ncbi:MAG: adenylate/guanylate cyclase domain-containing protein [Verrucomicrobiota bacterium]
MMRAGIFYLATVSVIAVYGGEVCPFVDSMGIVMWLMVLVPVFGLGFLMRAWLFPLWMAKVEPLRQPLMQFRLDFVWFAGMGAIITFFNLAFFAFPIVSGVFVTVGIISMGLFAAIDLALERERRLGQEFARSGAVGGDIAAGSFAPFSRQMSAFAAACLLVVALDLILILRSDLAWMHSAGMEGFETAGQVVFLEVGIIFLVILGLVLNLVFSFSRNLKMVLDHQTAVLRRVSGGELGERVPVFTRNEFGVIARYTNEMIEGLKERDRIKNVFGKFVSPQVAERLLDEDGGGVKLGGSRHHVAILMSDIRSFTTRTEGSDPEDVVKDLNRYFAEMVAIVHAHGGVVDKFIGDGLLAVFGLEATEGAERMAVAAAEEMVKRVKAIEGELSAPMEIGVGVHSGEVVAGNIGAPDRFEFTVIGDAVNTAARLEAMCKPLGVSIAFSEGVKRKLGATGEKWRSLGAQVLKGKAEAVEVFGAG